MEKFTAPKVGDTVNHVSPGRQKITPVKVVSVSAQHEGRLITVEVPGKKKNEDGVEMATLEKVTVSYRPKEIIAGNTWHF